MSNIQPYLDNIMKAVYGEEVRGSIHDAIKEIDSVASTAQNSATANAATAAQKASEAKASELAAKASEEASAQSETNAKTYAENAAAIAGAGIATQDTAGFIKGGDNYVDEAGTLTLTKTTTDRTLLHSHAGGLRIESVAGESVQESTTGAQLLELANEGTDWEYTEKGIKNLSYIDGLVLCEIELNANTVYTISFENVVRPSTSTTLAAYVNNTSNTDISISNFNQYAERKVLSFTPDVDTSLIYRLWGNSNSETIEFKMQIEAGTEATEYEPYTGGQPSPSPSYQQDVESSVVSEIKVVGKNLLKNNATTQTINGVTFTVNNDGSVTANGTATSLIAFTLMTQLSADREMLHGKELVLSGKEDGSSGSYIQFWSYDGANTFAYSKNNAREGKFTFTNENSGFNTAIIVGSGETLNNVVFRPMLREASIEDATYTPYTETTINLSAPITLNGIGEAKDRIVKQDGVWGVERNVYSVIFKGTENPQVFSPGSGGLLLGYYNSSVKLNSGSSIITGSFCNYLKEVTPDALWSNIITGFAISNTGYPIRIRFDENINTVDEAKEWLASKYSVNEPLTIMVPIASPTFEPLPEADQIALHSLVTYGTVTYLSTDSEIEPVVTSTYGTSKVGAESIWNANRVVVLEKEKEASEAALNAEIEALQSGHNVLTYSAFEQIPGYTPDMTLTQIINIMPNNSMLQLGAYMGTYSKLGLPSTISGAMGILTIRKTEQYPTQYFHDYETGDYYMGCYGTNWRLLSTTAVATAETTE